MIHKSERTIFFQEKGVCSLWDCKWSYSLEHTDWDNREVFPSISDQSGSDPSLRALFIMFNGVNTFLIKIQGGQRAFFSWRCNYLFMRGAIITRSYTNIIMSICTSLQRLLPIVLIRHFSHSLKKLFPSFIFSSAQRERRNVITVTYSLENSRELLSNIYFY